MSFCKGALSSTALVVCLSAIVAPGARATGEDLALTLIQAGARVLTPPRPNPVPPRMYVCEGCDGSTATLATAVAILEEHGIDSGEPSIDRELLTRDVPIQEFHEKYRKRNETLVFKSILHRDKDKTLSKSLLDLETLGLYVTRKNQLDHLTCMIRDCFWTNEKYGYPVSSDGKKSNLCFERRSDGEGAGYKAKLEVTKYYPNPNPEHEGHYRSMLKENLDRVEQLTSEGYQWLKEAGYKGPMLYYEDLMAFERGGMHNVESSLKLWVKLLKAWGVVANEDKVRQYLRSKEGTWKQQRQQGEIYNYHEVAAELKVLGREHLLRD